MSSKDQNLSEYQFDGIEDIGEIKIGIAISKWNESITSKLLEGCMETLISNGIQKSNITVAQVPGSFELPVAAKMLLSRENHDAVICIGCVIKGETSHDQYINQAVANGLVNLGMMSGKPVIFGVLTPNTEQQAIDRAGGKYGNKGVEAAQTALNMISLSKELSQQKKTIGF